MAWLKPYTWRMLSFRGGDIMRFDIAAVHDQVRTLVELAMSSHVEHKVASSVLGSKYVRLDPDDGVADVNLIEDNTLCEA